MIAALYVYADGIYASAEGVDMWDAARDARLYDGPWPVVAHPPCNRWSVLAPLNEAQHGYKVGDDGGCFAAALEAVRTWGGVLEHPAGSLAWRHFDLPLPVSSEGWTQSLTDPGWSCIVAQSAYGHEARKLTWLYYVGELPPLPLSHLRPRVEAVVGGFYGRKGAARMQGKRASATPLPFRDALLELARMSAG